VDAPRTRLRFPRFPLFPIGGPQLTILLAGIFLPDFFTAGPENGDEITDPILVDSDSLVFSKKSKSGKNQPPPSQALNVNQAASAAPGGNGDDDEQKRLQKQREDERLARALRLNINSPTTRQIIDNANLTVRDFVGRFRQASIGRELPGEFLDTPVKDAIRTSDTVRKLLLQSRFFK
jgi:hypothetical protein